MDNLDIPIESEVLSGTRSLPKQTIAFATLGSCLLLGIGGTFLFNNTFFVNGKFWGLNVALFGMALVVCLLFLRKIGERPLSFASYVLIASGLFFTITLAWRDSLVLNALSLLGLILNINLAFSLGTRKKLQAIYVSEALFDMSLSIKYGLISYHHLISQDMQWHEVQRLKGQFGRAIYRGLFITIPLFFLFALLLIASDARFEKIVYSLLDWGWEPKKIIQHSGIFIIISLFVAAILRACVLKKGLIIHQRRSNLPGWNLGTIEVVMLLGAINVLFLGFIVVQFSYFFGGDALVQSLDGPTYAVYARRGFFQLVAVAILVIILLLVTHWAYKSSKDVGEKIYLWLAAIMMVLTMIIEISAAHRMSLYTNVYGLTELRFYTSVFMGWVLVLFGWFSVTVLRGHRAYFSFGAVLTGMVFIGLLHAVNPDARIAEVNIARLQEGQRLDSNYLVSLSADVIPTLYAISESKYNCKNLWRKLQTHKVLQMDDNWRYFNLSRYQARKLLLSISEPKCQ